MSLGASPTLRHPPQEKAASLGKHPTLKPRAAPALGKTPLSQQRQASHHSRPPKASCKNQLYSIKTSTESAARLKLIHNHIGGILLLEKWLSGAAAIVNNLQHLLPLPKYTLFGELR